MAFVPCDLYVLDNTPQQNPVPNVVVRVFSQDGSIPFTQVITDVNGHAGFLLPDTATYQVRFYLFQASFINPQYIQVLPAPGVNTFNITAEFVTPPISQDPRLCVAFGHFRNGDGSPQSGLILHFIPKFKPLLVDGNAVMPEQMMEHTDSDGYLEVNLFRNGHYDVTVEGLEDYQRLIRVPDLNNVNLPDLLFPVVESITFSPPPPVTLSVGGTLQLRPTVYLSDGNVDCNGSVDVTWKSDNPLIFGVQLAGGVLTLLGVSAGTANLVACRNDHTIIRIPNTPIAGVPLLITVH